MDVKRKVDIIRVNPQDWPNGTPTWKEEDPDLGYDLIPADRYTSEAFAKLEWERIWTKVWLLGGRSDDIKEPGDYICTEIGKESVLIVRQHDMSVRAFYNVCLHRGNKLRPEGLGNAENFRCMYHHWTYGLDGEIQRIPDLDTFPQGCPPGAKIPSLPCAEWGSFVWFSLNPDVEPLERFLDPMPKHLDPYHLERMAWVRDITVEWDCNWKASVDAFSEVYHVQGIHPQLQWYLDDTNAQIDVYERHSRYLVPFATVSGRVALPSAIPPAIYEIMVKAGMDPAEYEGRVSDIRRDVQLFKRAHGAEQGKDYSELNDDQLTDDYHYSIFPNVSMNVHADDVMMFRQRPHPTDPNKMFYDIWMIELVPEGEEWPERPKHKRFKHGDRTIGQVLDQDAFNLPTVQKGMQSAGFKGLWVGDQELRIRHFHKVIDDYVYPDGKAANDI
ncbi:phenylpropionate dioxygenase-like ring-hydroxylating dioxygenase large terminal subunit [Sphingomonas jejuensis]|uniref:Phenylpropionate dioxygenase-like ring-hydroxylating dioxygenase large terminal subunit n=1 Tax=Sphingomonas jejuensis TaxID=904715 RepID=A0ABX0XJ48_9SPHN|nr:aromatic ring-hydroxylating dioxygenase subunit alpha [Sphingomonas jejuensis]NJC32902.1 phenylpropionate dioxygenase-like ring-hydroxylating dioxygenase large terminal subunit [Sphingomonas jejuensis]